MQADYAFELRWVPPSHKTIIAANRFNLPFFPAGQCVRVSEQQAALARRFE